MKFFPASEDLVLYEKVFEKDIFNRKKIGEKLSKIIEEVEDPLVIAINGRWGTGKTYFLKRWVGSHTKQNNGKAITVYFDAFSHDYAGDPLVSLISCIESRIQRKEKSKFEKVKIAAEKIRKPALRMFLSLATYGATEVLSDTGDKIAESLSSEISDGLSNIWEKERIRIAAMDEFRNSISELIESQSNDGEKRPLVIVIDELDRCRPDYALELLEIIKHFFSVNKVHFILGVNMESLENSVKMRYGNNIDSASYLNKFINIYLELPDFVIDANRNNVNKAYIDDIASGMGLNSNVIKELSDHVEMISNKNKISLRDVEKILSNLVLLSDNFPKNSNMLYGWLSVSITIIVCKHIRSDLYKKMIESNISEDDIISYMGYEKSTLLDENEMIKNYPNYVYVINFYRIWMFIIKNGDIEDNNKEYIRSLFNNFINRNNIKNIPSLANRQLLDIFKI